MDTPQNELNDSLRTMFSFQKTGDEKKDEALHAFGSTAHLLTQMIVRTGTRPQEGTEAIRYLGLAFMLYRMGQERKPAEEPKEEEPKS